MEKIIPNIGIENCQTALEYYKKVFGGEIQNLQMADGKEMFKGHEGKIVHAELFINNHCVIYFNDIFDEMQVGDNISLMLQMDSENEIKNIYSALGEQGNVIFELQKTFWGSHHAVVKDRFGIIWNLDYSGR
jgi:Uncharacterized protein conserved in bacteria